MTNVDDYSLINSDFEFAFNNAKKSANEKKISRRKWFNISLLYKWNC